MTRFARAKGSKSSNERIPERATSWTEMKQQLIEKNKEIEESKKRKAAENIRKENYNAFLEEFKEKESKETKWADFPGVKKPETTAKPKNKLKEKAKLTIVTKLESKMKANKKIEQKDEEELSGKEMESDGEDIEEFNNIKTKLDKILDDIESNNDSQSTSFLRDDDADDSDAPPEEFSSKIEPQIQKSNSKSKKKPLKIVIDKEQGAQEADKIESNTKNKKDKKQETQEKTVTKTKKKKKRQLDSGENDNTGQPKKVKAPQVRKVINMEELTEGERKKIEKAQQKKIKQLEKRKLKKAKLKEQKRLEKEKPTADSKQSVSTTNPKSNKTKDNKVHERKKPHQPNKMIINGKEVDIDYFDGFPIKKEDHTRLVQLRKQMISKGLPRSEINVALKLERRRAEKAFTREKKKVCFNCRQSGHNLSECPTLGNSQLTESSATGICFKCGSTEHTHYECKVVRGQEFRYAQCFICNEQGHIARQCPDNARGLYPKGGACKECGDVTHLKRDCPKFQAQQQREDGVEVGTISGSNPDDLDIPSVNMNQVSFSKPNKIIKF